MLVHTGDILAWQEQNHLDMLRMWLVAECKQWHEAVDLVDPGMA